MINNLIIDCDPGNGFCGANVDDSLALIYLLLNYDKQIKAISTVFGNTTSPDGLMAVNHILEVIDKNILTICGSNEPISGRGQFWREYLDNNAKKYKHLWKNFPKKNTLVPQSHIEFIENLRGLIEQNNPTTILALGPLTNIARLITNYPQISSHISHIYCMGGCLNFSDLVDTNFAIDPQAVSIVLESHIPLTLAPLNLTRQVLMTTEQWQSIYKQATINNHNAQKQKLVHFMNNWLMPWLYFSEQTRNIRGMWLHDLTTAMLITHPEIFNVQKQYVKLDLNHNIGKLILSPDEGYKVNIATKVAKGAVLQHFSTSLLNQ